MRRFLIAAALAAALFSPAVLAPTAAAAATSCYSQTIGFQTSTSCYGDNGSYISGGSIQVGSQSSGSYYGQDANGRPISVSGGGTTIGSSTSSTWWTNP